MAARQGCTTAAVHQHVFDAAFAMCTTAVDALRHREYYVCQSCLQDDT